MERDTIQFNEHGLVPVITQDESTKSVLMLAYMNANALDLTMRTGKVHYWSRSRQEIWLKGETSGNYQYVKSIRYDCDADALLIMVDQKGNACHTGSYSCFYNCLEDYKESSNTIMENQTILREVYQVIEDRVKNPKKDSYTNYLFDKGLDKMLKKVGEEAAEVIIAAKNRVPSEVRYEVADLFYHILVVLVEQGIPLEDVYEELKSRR